MSEFYLPEGLPAPSAAPDGLSQPYWDGAREGKLRIQRCRGCGAWQWGPEWVCHRCHSFDLAWEDITGRGRIWSYQRPHHPVHPALNGHGPYIVVLVELPEYGGVRMVGNLLGDPRQEVRIGAPVEAVFEHHKDYSLVQWKLSL
ncbi:MAG TPA: OB-fold domain-containing protein [Acetobacteraceae bacterium]|nr:OB-fold domain-containing protein [Acetobacteraceae bacterium]